VSEDLNLGDITKVDEKELADFDLMTWGFPCQDISVAGNQTGFKDENGNITRSGLYKEGLRILKEKKPKISIIENVKNLTSKKFKKEFETVLNDLNECGYNTYWKILNAKDYGIPQNRERVFIVSIRKDIDSGKFKFPEKVTGELSVMNFLDNEVDKDYYVNDYFIQQIKNTKYRNNDSHKENTLLIANFKYDNFAIMDYRYDEGLRIRKNNLCPTLTTRGKQSISGVPIIYNKKTLRFITPKECWRLMGFSDTDYEKVQNIITIPQLYKQAGNSIVVDILYYIYKELYIVIPEIFDDLKLSSFFSGIGAFEKALDKFYTELS